MKKITQARQRLFDAIDGLSEEEMAWSPDQDWSIRQTLHHVAIGEEANVELVERALGVHDPMHRRDRLKRIEQLGTDS